MPPSTGNPCTIIQPHLHKYILKSLECEIQPEPIHVHSAAQNKKSNASEPSGIVAPSTKPKETHQTNIIGYFTCATPSCSKRSWQSGRVAMVIQRFEVSGGGLGYNATIYNQRCVACKQFGILRVEMKCYIERVVYRLKKWAGVQVEAPPFDGRKKMPPHKSDLCEGCKRGVCLAGSSVGGGGVRSGHGSRPG